MDIAAIDFKKLLKEEKRKAREQRKQEKNQNQQAQKERQQQQQLQSQLSDSNDNDNKNGNFQSNNVVSKPKIIPVWKHNDNNHSFLSLKTFQKNKHLITSNNPSCIAYIPNCFQNNTEAPFELWDWLLSNPNGDDGVHCWKTMKYGKRRVMMVDLCDIESNNINNHDDNSQIDGTRQNHRPPQQQQQHPLQLLANALVKSQIFDKDTPPNHVLINEYLPGQGILPHTDGPMYYHKTATISLGSPCLLHFTKRQSPDEIGIKQNHHDDDASKFPKVELLLEPNSLVVFQDDAYISYCHGIDIDTLIEYTSPSCSNSPPNVEIKRGHRLSITFRHKQKSILE